MTGKSVTYVDLDGSGLRQTLRGSGVLDAAADFAVALSAATARGDLDTDPAALTSLIGHPRTPLDDAIKAAVSLG